MTVVVDASVAVKWVLQEDQSDIAATLRNEGGLIAPSLICAEVGNALWKAVSRRAVRAADAMAASKAALMPLHALIPNEQLHARALEIALELKHPIYDCFYLALAERERAPLISADSRLLKMAARLKGVQARSL